MPDLSARHPDNELPYAGSWVSSCIHSFRDQKAPFSNLTRLPEQRRASRNYFCATPNKRSLPKLLRVDVRRGAERLPGWVLLTPHCIALAWHLPVWWEGGLGSDPEEM